ncbi:MAG: glutamate 5-kinase [Vicinamibacterales bacterium]|nr:glutamate 5-kinase [Vicinamibacterales bacterium]
MAHIIGVLDRAKRLVVKVGTNTLTGGEDGLSRPHMLGVARQIAKLVREGHQVALVSSGAIVAGREALKLARNGKDIPFKQVLAAVGQAKLMQKWDALFSAEDIVVAQTLLTRGDLADRQGYLNARNTLLALLERKVVPIINENDVVATEEIKIGDNDNLSALVANLIDADLLILLTDQAGLYTADPRRSSTATLIPEVRVISDDIMALAAGAGTSRGTGGMVTKVQAARLATESGVTVLVAGGTTDNVLVRAAHGEAIGTRFPSSRTRLESRKRWILAGLGGKGAAHIDEGAAAALQRGRSLLPAGIVTVKGPFDRGDSVNIVGPEGKAVACGVANYSALDLQRIKGCRSAQITEILGYHFGDEVIHRNNVVML